MSERFILRSSERIGGHFAKAITKTLAPTPLTYNRELLKDTRYPIRGDVKEKLIIATLLEIMGPFIGVLVASQGKTSGAIAAAGLYLSGKLIVEPDADFIMQKETSNNK